MTQLDSRKPMRNPRTASRVFNGEAVVISPVENIVRLFNPVGSRIWELADGTRTAEALAISLTGEFAVDLDHARASVAGFLTELDAKGLLVWA